MPRVFTDYDLWSFTKADQDRWTCRRESPDGELLLEVRSHFPAFDDCVEDVGRFGYNGALTVPGLIRLNHFARAPTRSRSLTITGA